MSHVGPTTAMLLGAGPSLAADLHGDETDPPVVVLRGGGRTRHAWEGAAASLGAGAGLMVAGDRDDSFDAAVIEFVGRHGDVAG